MTLFFSVIHLKSVSKKALAGHNKAALDDLFKLCVTMFQSNSANKQNLSTDVEHFQRDKVDRQTFPCLVSTKDG